MVRSLTARVVMTTFARLDNDFNNQAVTRTAVTVDGSVLFADGVEADQANRFFHMPETTIVSGGTLVVDVYDLADIDMGLGNGLDAVGQTVALEEIACIGFIKTGDGTLTVDSDPTNGWGAIDTITLPPGSGAFLRNAPDIAGLDVEDSTSHRMRMQAVGGDVTVELVIIGRTDDDASSSSSSTNSSSVSTSSESSTSEFSSFSSVSSSSTSTASSSSSSLSTSSSSP